MWHHSCVVDPHGRALTMASQQSATVWVEAQDGSGLRHEIKLGSHVVGRSPDVDLLITSEWVSHHHAELAWDGQRLRVRDLGSRNGTAVNNEAVVDWATLRDGDMVSFASLRFVVHISRSEPLEDHATGSSSATAPQEPSHPVQVPRRLSAVPIFISHSSQDKRAARSVAVYLRRVGWTVWIDEAGIAGGKDWRAELVRALEQTWVVVLLVSLASMRSKWVIREVEAADRLGKTIIPVVVEEAPYPDALRMILGGVQRLDLTSLHDEDRRGQQLTRLDDALILTARQRAKTPPGKTQIAVGKTIAALGLVGLVAGFGLFIAFGFLAARENPSSAEEVARPFIAWGIFAVSLIVAAIGEGIRRAGMRKGI